MKLAKPNKTFVMDVAGILIGAVAAKFVIKAIDKAMPNQTPLIKSLVPVGVGVFFAMQKNQLVKNAGFGMIGSGGVELANVIIPGIGAPMVPDVFMDGADEDDMLMLSAPADQFILSGPADQSILSGGPADQSILSGAPMGMEEQMYYRLNGEMDNF
jgi:hypothetical protein